MLGRAKSHISICDPMGAQNLEVPNWPNLEEIFVFWHHWPFSGTVWSLNPNFDTESLKFMVNFQCYPPFMGSNANFRKNRSGFDFGKIRKIKKIENWAWTGLWSNGIGRALGDPKLEIKNSGFEAPGPPWAPRGPKFKGLYLKVPPRFDDSRVSTIPLKRVNYL